MKLLLSFLSAVLISGCATGPIYHPVAPPAPDQALLYIYRVSTLSGVLVRFKLDINGANTTGKAGIVGNQQNTGIVHRTSITPTAFRLHRSMRAGAWRC